MSGISRNYSRIVAVALCLLVTVQPILAQQGLKIVLIEGARARNVVLQIAARPITIRVEDASGRPLADVPVTFTSPQQGPSGEFSNNLRTLSITTDSRGIAAAEQYHPNAITGT